MFHIPKLLKGAWFIVQIRHGVNSIPELKFRVNSISGIGIYSLK